MERPRTLIQFQALWPLCQLNSMVPVGQLSTQVPQRMHSEFRMRVFCTILTCSLITAPG
jgi:hypothetical protein